MATTMLLDAKLDKKYWGEAVLAATYLQNRLPSRSVDTTPFEKWYGRKPNVRHLRVYGSQAWVHIPDVKRGKFDSKAQKLTFIGYSEQHKGYRFVDLATEKVVISRDAKFLEFDSSPQAEVEVDSMTDGVEWLAAKDSARDRHSVVEPVPELMYDSDAEGEDAVSDNPTDPSDHDDQSECEQFFDLSSTPSLDDPLGMKQEPEGDDQGESSSRDVRKTRNKLPKRYNDFEVGFATHTLTEPATYNEAMKCPERDSWKQAMDDEMVSHKENGTWDLVHLPPGKKVIGSRWVYKAKVDETGQVVRLKARVVAQGHTQRFGVDFSEVFAPVIRHATLRTLLALAGKKKMILKHLDVRTAYLYGDINEEAYMRQPPGYAVRGQEEKVCRLRRSIYGLHQSARCWNKKLSEVLKGIGFVASSADPCLYIAVRNGSTVYLIVYVDDMLVGCTNEEELTRVYSQLKEHFDINCLGKVKHFLGLEITKDVEGVYSLSVQLYIKKLITEFGMASAKVARSPMDQGYLKDTSKNEPLKDITMYRSLVGALMYIAVCARPDIAASAAILGRKFSDASERDWTAAKRVLRYLKWTSDWKLKLGGSNNGELEAYSDSDWAGDPGTRKSTTGFVVFFAGGAVSWASRRQDCVSLSSMEAEYVALGETCQEVLWLRRLLEDFGEKQKAATTVHEDNQGCLAFVQSDKTSRRSKHINTKECFVRDLCERGEVKLQYCPSDVMRADVFTKPLGHVKHQGFATLIGIQGSRGATAEEE